MQPIERYGIIALLLLIVIIAAVVLWDQAEQPLEVRAQNAPAPALQGLSREAVASNVSKAPLVPKAPPAATTTPTPASQEAANKPAFQAQGWQPESTESEARRKKDEAAKFLEQVARAERELAQEPEVRTLSKLAGNLIEPTPQPEPRAQPPASKGRTYTVQSGDTMGQIAIDQLGAFKQLALLQAANPSVDPAHMTVGTELVLPEVPATETASATPSPAKQPATAVQGGRTYTVAAGDSLWSIAARELGNGNRYREIASLNPKVNPDVLILGQALVLPEGSASNIASASLHRLGASPAVATAAAPKKGVVR